MTPQEKHQLLVYEAISRIVHDQKLELVELNIVINKRDATIQVLVDRPQGGITIQECTRINRAIVEAIDKESFFSEDGYSLEVSSPGLDRPLVTYKDFLRHIGAEVSVLLKEKIEGKIEHVGVVTSVTEATLTLLTAKDKKEIIVPVDQIVKGLLVI